ncbi:MAG: putrescine ABC transporter permease PotI, partial [Stenotrophomonas sp.]
MSMVRSNRWLGWSLLGLGFAFLYLPILLLMVYS